MKAEVLKKNKDARRLVIDVNDRIHQEVKYQATFRNISIRRYVLQAILEKINRDKDYL